MVQMVRNLPGMQETQVLAIPELGRIKIFFRVKAFCENNNGTKYYESKVS